MDTKLKKSKLIISFLSFFLGVNLLLVSALLIWYVSDTDELTDIRTNDYQETSAFRDFIGTRLEIFINMAVGENILPYYNSYYGYDDDTLRQYNIITSTADVYEISQYDEAEFVLLPSEKNDTYDEEQKKQNLLIAESFHESIRYDRNLIYSISYDGKVLYSNDEEIPNGIAEAASLPSGYNFWLKFDGTSVTIIKDGKTVDIYGDGYYRGGSDWYVPGYRNIATDENIKSATIYMAVAYTPKPYSYAKYGNSGYRNNYSSGLYEIWSYTQNRSFVARFISIIAVTGACLFLASLFMGKSRKTFKKSVAAFTGKIYLELRIAGFGLAWFIICSCLYRLLHEKMMLSYDFSLMLSSYISLFWLAYFAINDWYYNRPVWKQSILYLLLSGIKNLLSTREMSLPLSKRIVYRFMPLFVCWVIIISFSLFFMLILLAWSGGDGLVLDFILFIILGIISLLFFSLFRKNKQLALDLDMLSTKITAIHNGDYNYMCELAGSSDLSPIAEELEDIRTGMSTAVEERIKSERMKVELITNVSHDLKTPLTSIISYVELLKQEAGLPAHIKDYVNVLDEKTQRLNQMIQDVFAVSKAASGQLPVNMEQIDFGKLLRQTLADMGEQIDASSFSIKVIIPETPVLIMADGQRMYRVFLNLIQNALKYSLEGSRIYIQLTTQGENAMASIKNTSSQEINSALDFSERFVRGDKSRSDGGSGLGLSIAKSFTESCGGSFNIETNADLFVVTVSFTVL